MKCPPLDQSNGGCLVHQIIDECLDLGGCHGLRCGIGLLRLIVLGLGIALLHILNKFLQTLPSLTLELYHYHFVCHGSCMTVKKSFVASYSFPLSDSIEAFW